HSTHYSSSLLFFITDTSTTAIYTLSLHDALPIFDQTMPVRKPRSLWPTNPVVTLWSTMVGKKVVMAVTGLVLVGFVVAHMLGNLDRKSTRLNSSHVSISYAVFCLKKKKKLENVMI